MKPANPRIPQVLDCTFRDGGYYTDWDFERKLFIEYLTTMADCNIQFIEVGYRGPESKEYKGEFFHLSRSVLSLARQVIRPNQKVAVMFNEKEVSADTVAVYLSDCAGLVDLVRFAVAPDRLASALEVGAKVKGMGFSVALNLMYLSKYYDDREAIGSLEPANGIFDYVSLVDSYGACYPEDVGKGIRHAKEVLTCNIGFHGHDNLSLAFANTLAAIEAGVDCVDSTIQGMGRGAGNLRTELILAYLAQSAAKPGNLTSISGLVNTFGKMKRNYGWGTDLPYIISGLNNLAQKDVMEWTSKRRYKFNAIIQVLHGITNGLVSEEDFPELSSAKGALGIEDSTDIMVIGGGPLARRHSSALIEFAQKHCSVTILVSSKNLDIFVDADLPLCLCLPGHEADKLRNLKNWQNRLPVKACIVQSTPRFSGTVPNELADITFKTSPIHSANVDSQLGPIDDAGPLALALGACLELRAAQIYIAGFDGYENPSQSEQELSREVQALLNGFAEDHPETPLASLTPTSYNVTNRSVYAILQ